MTPFRKKKPMGKVTRGTTAEGCLRRILEGWVPSTGDSTWVRPAPGGSIAWRREPWTREETLLLTEIRETP